MRNSCYITCGTPEQENDEGRLNPVSWGMPTIVGGASEARVGDTPTITQTAEQKAQMEAELVNGSENRGE